MEMIWAMKAHHHAETYFKVCCFVITEDSAMDPPSHCLETFSEPKAWDFYLACRESEFPKII